MCATETNCPPANTQGIAWCAALCANGMQLSHPQLWTKKSEADHNVRIYFEVLELLLLRSWLQNWKRPFHKASHRQWYSKLKGTQIKAILLQALSNFFCTLNNIVIDHLHVIYTVSFLNWNEAVMQTQISLLKSDFIFIFLSFAAAVCLLLRWHFTQETEYKNKLYLLLYNHRNVIQ